MNSKECLEFILSSMKLPRQFPKETTFRLCVEKVKQDLEEKEKLEKEHEKLKEKYKHRAETSNDLCEAVKRYEKVFEILKENYFRVEENANTDYGYIAFIEADLTKEEYELLKEVFEK